MEEDKVIEQVVEQPEEQSEPEVQAPQPQPNNAAQESFRLLRDKTERAERERDEAVNKMREYEQRMSTVKTDEEDLSFNIGDDDIVEGRHIAKFKKSTQRELDQQKKEFQELKKQTHNLFVETRLKSEMPDLDKVVSSENLKLLSERFPELASTLSTSPDYYTQAKSAYTLIKNLGIGSEDKYLPDKEAAKKNAAKPVPSSAISAQRGSSPLDMANMFANGLTDDVKAQIREQVLRNIDRGK